MKQAVDLIITGTLFADGNLLEEASLVIDQGKIIGLGRGPFLPPARETWKIGAGAWILPGIVDAHVHCGSNPEEGFERATRAAAAGGVTTLIDHPLDFPQGLTSPAGLKEKLARLENESHVDVALLGGVTDDNLEEIAPLARAGVCGFKILMQDTAPGRFPRMHDGPLFEALGRIAETGRPAGVHAENDEMIHYLVERARRSGRIHPRAHTETRPPVTELEAVQRAMALALEAGAHLHFFHLSLAGDFEWIAAYRRRGLAVTAETCPQYLLLSAEAMDRLRGYGKINPPLRAEGEGEALWRLAEKGEVDFITSDHAPWPAARKERESIFDCASGSPGVQTLFPLIFSEGVRRGRISLRRLVQLLAENPARTFQLYPRKGTFLPGADADMVVVDPKKRWRLERQELHSAAGWSLFEGMTLEGKVVMTISRGRKIYEEGAMLAPPGGRFVPPPGGVI